MRKVAIVGRGPTWVSAPFSDREWEIWGLAWVEYPREDLSFDIHKKDACVPETIVTSLAISKDKNNIIAVDGSMHKNCQRFPEEKILEISQYLESSIAYMLAYAILEKVDEVMLYGVHMERKEEYLHQLPNIEYLIGLARGMGMKVEVCPGAPIMVSRFCAGRYGVTQDKRW